jgi:hypothetical protein
MEEQKNDGTRVSGAGEKKGRKYDSEFLTEPRAAVTEKIPSSEGDW